MATSKNMNTDPAEKVVDQVEKVDTQDPWEIIAQMNARIKQLETTKKEPVHADARHTPPPDLSKEPKRKINLFLDNDKYKDDVFVGINGRTFLIKRGVDVEVPESVAKVLEDSGVQQQYAYSHMRNLQDMYENNKQPGT